jgi:hypothetical protein
MAINFNLNDLKSLSPAAQQLYGFFLRRQSRNQTSNTMATPPKAR